MNNLIINEYEKSKNYDLSVTNNVVDLTLDNVARVEAMIRYDSAYRKSSDINAKPKGKYQGSTSYHINEFKNSLKVIQKMKINIKILSEILLKQ